MPKNKGSCLPELIMMPSMRFNYAIYDRTCDHGKTIKYIETIVKYAFIFVMLFIFFLIQRERIISSHMNGV
jgi:hypothetical protein